MNTPQRKPHPESAPTPLRINVEGDPATVAALLAAMVGALGEYTTQPEPDALRLSRTEAAVRSGRSIKEISRLVAEGKLRNLGTPGNMLFSLADLARLDGEP